MMKFLRVFVFTFALLLVVLPHNAHAANATFFGPIVPAECHCDNQTGPDGIPITTAPDYGCVLQTIQNSINFAISFAGILFVIYTAVAGFRLITSGGSPAARNEGKTRLINVIIGLVVLLCSWLIVDFVMKTLYDEGKFGPWNAILAGATDASDRCIVAKTPNGLTTGTVDILKGTVPGTTAAGGIGGSSSLDISKATSYATSHAESHSTNKCATYVRKALAAGGLSSFNIPKVQYAYQYGPVLKSAGFTEVLTSKYNSSLENSISNLRQGDVVVFQPVGSHTAGHIAIYNGSKWVSDYVQNTMTSSRDYIGTSFTIYRP